MLRSLTDWLAIASLAMTAVGCGYALAATVVVLRFFRRAVQTTAASPSVTILKPLYGAEPSLYDDLASFCNQDYPAPVQVLFGVRDPADPAVPVVKRLIKEYPDLDLQLVVNASDSAANPKIANLMGLQREIRNDVVLISDSDVAVQHDYLSRTIAALYEPGVGLVTCLYCGRAEAGLWAQLTSMTIDYHFMPNVLVGTALGLARPCFGSTMALRRGTLTAIGGCGAFRQQLADDNAIGDSVRATGLRVAIPPFIVVHRCTERSARELLQHELRWARTLRVISPKGYAGLIITHPLPFALLGAFSGRSWILGAGIVAAAIACRLALQLQVDHALHLSSKRAWLGPARDLIAFAVYIASFFVDVVQWRGQRFKVRADGTLVPIQEPKT